MNANSYDIDVYDTKSAVTCYGPNTIVTHGTVTNYRKERYWIPITM